MKVFKCGPTVLTKSGASAVTNWQIDQVRIDERLETVLLGGGTVDDVFAGVVGNIPLVEFDTPALARTLGVIGYSGANITQADFYFPQRENMATTYSTASHMRVRISNALGLMRPLSARQGEVVKGSFALVATFDGTNAPLAYAINQSLPTAAAVADIEAFTIGGAYLNTTSLDIVGAEFDPGATEAALSANGSQYASFVSISERASKFSFETLDLEVANTLGAGGSESTNVRLFLRALENMATPVADATASHIKIQAAKGMVSAKGPGGQGKSDATLTIETQAILDPPNAAITISTGQAIA